ncbi:MAG TPA: hypothetical protein VFK41_01635 [Nocardioidaceae bacterium]|nr:hypothetical protein [Nocardioidaceae bacterium]
MGTAAAPAVAVAAGAYAIGAVVGGLLNRDDEDRPRELALPEIRKGTEQAQLVDLLDRYIRDLRNLRSGPKPDAVVDPSIEALVAAESGYGTAVRVAAAVDGLDTALSRSTATPSTSNEVREAVQRMADRRAALLEKLRSMVDEVAEVYTKLLEMSAAVSSLDLGMGATEDVEKVNSSLDSLRHTLADLESQADKEA